jgi:sporulation protein YqfD
MTEAVNLGIALTDVEIIGDITLRFFAKQKYKAIIKNLAVKHGGDLQIISGFHFKKALDILKKRSFLLFGVLMLLILTIKLPQHILFIQVQGNVKLSDDFIIAKAQQCGISFGAERKEIRSENIKNTLLATIPDLQWVGVNTSGCVAIISVLERNDEKKNSVDSDICSIIADRDGVIKKCTVVSGNPLCKPGQAVKAGQTLVSGYMDTGLFIRAVEAEAEISALTNRELWVIALDNAALRDSFIREENKFSMIIGKKLINFFKDSGILDSTCVKINKIYPLVLPGGFILPISVIHHKILYYDGATDAVCNERDYQWLSEYAQTYLREKMVAGTILDKRDSIHTEDGCVFLYGSYFCEESIGKTKKEVNLKTYAKDG